MSDCWRYGDVLKLRADWIAREDPDGDRYLRSLRSMVVDEKSIMFIAPTSSPRLYPPLPDCWERAEKDDLPPGQAMFVNGPVDGRAHVVGEASVWQVMEVPAIPHPVYADEEITAEPITIIKHEYERCRCGCGRMIWRRDWT